MLRTAFPRRQKACRSRGLSDQYPGRTRGRGVRSCVRSCSSQKHHRKRIQIQIQCQDSIAYNTSMPRWLYLIHKDVYSYEFSNYEPGHYTALVTKTLNTSLLSDVLRAKFQITRLFICCVNCNANNFDSHVQRPAYGCTQMSRDVLLAGTHNNASVGKNRSGTYCTSATSSAPENAIPISPGKLFRACICHRFMAPVSTLSRNTSGVKVRTYYHDGISVIRNW